MSAKRLTAKEKLFCSYYIKDRNATQAAIKAGYSKKNARFIAAENLSKHHIRAEIDKKLNVIQERAHVDAEWVLVRLKEVANRCMQKVPVEEFDHESKSMVQKVNSEGNGVWEFDSTGANKSLELLGKSIRLFIDKVEHSGEVDIYDRLKESRERVFKESQT